MKNSNACGTIACAAAFTVTMLLGTAIEAAHAAAPMARTSAPGFYRTMLGAFEVTALFDGVISMPVDKYMTNTTPGQVTNLLAKESLGIPLDLSVNAFLINTGAKLVLIDAGSGDHLGPALGKLVVNLRAAGYQPEQIDEVYLTHLHFDHVGGLASDGKPTFPNAIVRADRREADYWLSQAAMDRSPDEMKYYFKVAMAALAPYLRAGRFQPFDGDTEMAPGIKALARRGHTEGHANYLVESEGKKLLLWGDVMHVAAIQFPHPEVTIRSDSDSQAAAAERAKVFAEAAVQGYLIGAAHISYPGLGHVHTGSQGYRWVPLNYSPLRNK